MRPATGSEIRCRRNLKKPIQWVPTARGGPPGWCGRRTSDGAFCNQEAPFFGKWTLRRTSGGDRRAAARDAARFRGASAVAPSSQQLWKQPRRPLIRRAYFSARSMSDPAASQQSPSSEVPMIEGARSGASPKERKNMHACAAHSSGASSPSSNPACSIGDATRVLHP